MAVASSWIEGRAKCVHPLCDKLSSKVFLMLQAYMDDSGSHDESPVCVVGGYFGGVNRWIEFERRWKPILKKYGINEFHAKNFWTRTPEGLGKEEYEGWNRKKLDEFLDALLCVIQETRIYPFAIGVLRQDWEGFSIHDRKLMCGASMENLNNAPHKPIFFVFRWNVVRAASHCKVGIKMNFVFDNRPKTKPWASYCYDELKKQLPGVTCFGELTFADSHIAAPLQAADLLAYEARRWAIGYNGDVNFPMSSVYVRALTMAKSREDFWLFDKTRFADLIRSITELKKKHEKEK